MNWSINGKTVKSLMKDGKEIVKVERVEDGKILYEKQNNYSVATIAGSNVILGASQTHWLLSTDDVKIDWGDGTSDTINDPTQPLNHSYTDGLESHDIKIIGNVTSLGNYCFESCDLLSIEISDTVTRLGQGCFTNCQNLTTIIIPDNVTRIESYCFTSCDSLTSITIPDSVTSLEMACVYNCISLTSVSIPSSVTSIGYYCFMDCTALVDYQLHWTGNDILRYDSDKLMSNIDTYFTIPPGETANYIAKGYPSNRLSERYLNASFTGSSITLGNYSQHWLGSTNDVVIDWGDGTQSTVNNPDTALTHNYSDGESEHSIVFLGTVTSLGNNCFYECAGLTSIVIPNSVVNLEEYCFYGCTGLTNISIPSSVISFGDSCFRECTGLTLVTIPSSVTSLGNNCFYGCTGLTSVTIPNSVITIKAGCFNRCTRLIDYQLYWTGNDITSYDSRTMPNNTNTIYTIPAGTTNNYINKYYPSNKLRER